MKLPGTHPSLSAAWICTADTVVQLFKIAIFQVLHIFCVGKVHYCIPKKIYCVLSV